MSSFDSTGPEQLLRRGDKVVQGLCLLGGALLLFRLWISIAEGKPFHKGNAGRIVGISGPTVAGGMAELLQAWYATWTWTG